MKKITKLLLIIICSILFVPHSFAQETQKEKLNFLFVGVDAGYEEDRLEEMDGRLADAIMVLTIDPDANTLTISTIPRDSVIDIAGYGQNKINSSYSFGGKDLTIETVESLLGIQFDNYVFSNMSGFVDIINKLGGVTVIPPMSFNWWEKYFFEEKVEQHLDGDHALAYARERYTTGSDYARQGRMREMMTRLIKDLIEKGEIESYREIFENRYQYILTDFEFDQIVDLYQKFGNKELEIHEFQLNGTSRLDDELGAVEEIVPGSLEELHKIVQ